jgi:hypothetical protein
MYLPNDNLFLDVIIEEDYYTGCLKIREFRIQSVVGKDQNEGPSEARKILRKKNSLFLKKI